MVLGVSGLFGAGFGVGLLCGGFVGWGFSVWC